MPRRAAQFRVQQLDLDAERAYCTVCAEWKDFSEFHARNDGVQPIWPQCRSCKKAVSKESRNRIRERTHLRKPGTAVQTSTPKRTCASGMGCAGRENGPNPLPGPVVLSAWNDDDYCGECQRREQRCDQDKAQESGEFIEVGGKILTKQQAEGTRRQ
jgi:hypothetical protein